jgi:hypothetical protein
MPDFELGPQDSLYYEYEAPKAEGGFTFIFFNALTGDIICEVKLKVSFRPASN